MTYAGLSSKMKELLGLKGSPVAVLFSTEPPPGLRQMNGQTRLCQMLDRARLDGEMFYTTVENHECDGGAASSGLKEPGEQSKTGEHLAKKLGLFSTPRAARRFMRSNHRIEFGTVKAVSFSPLEKAAFEPDVVVLICNAKQGMDLAGASAYDSGEKATGTTGAPICSGVLATPFLTGEVVYSLGDTGARRFMKISDDDVFIGIPAELLPGIMENLGKMRAFHPLAPTAA